MVRVVATIVGLLGFLAIGAASADDTTERGEIRLTSPLSAIAWQLAVGPKDRFVAVSDRDGSVSLFDINDELGERSVFYSPIRDEEPDKQRPIALSPSGDLIALGAPLVRGKPNSAVIYFFRKSDTSSVIFTIDGLPSRPMTLRLSNDLGGKRLLLAAVLADGQRPMIWDVTSVAKAAVDPAVEASALGSVLDEPTANFFGDCGRSECHSWNVAFPPASSDVGLIVTADSGLVLYDQDFKLAGYAGWRERPEIRRAAGISFSPDGTKFALGKLALSKRELQQGDNHACAVDIYAFGKISDLVDADRKFKRERIGRLVPTKPRYETAGCYLGRVAWAGNSIFAAGMHIREFADNYCKTFKDLADEFGKAQDGSDTAEANAMLRWKSLDDNAPDMICIGTNTAMDVQATAAGGVAIVTQDPRLAVYDAGAKLSYFAGHARHERAFDGLLLDLRDNVGAEMSLDQNGGLVVLRPLRTPRAYVAFDFNDAGKRDPLIRVLNDDLASARKELMQEIAQRRGGEATLDGRNPSPSQCMGVDFTQPKSPLELSQINDLRTLLKLRAPEEIRDIEFVPPQAKEAAWTAVIGTSHSLMYLDCQGNDLWNGGKPIAAVGRGGLPLRDEAFRVRVTADRQSVVAAHGDGTIRWYRLITGELTRSLFIHPDLRNWVAWTPQGYFDSSLSAGNRLTGWLQSTPKAKGSWSVLIEPLVNYEKRWRDPTKVRDAILLTNPDAPSKAPNQAQPKLSLEIDNSDAVDATTFRFRIRIENAGDRSASTLPRFKLFAETMGQAAAKFGTATKRNQDWIIPGEFELNGCLTSPGRRSRIWAQFSDPELIDSTPSSRFITYTGESAGTCPKPKVWGIFIGISKYQPGFPDLRFADQDAKRMFEFWNRQSYYDRGELVLLEAPAGGAAKKTVVTPAGVATTEASDSSLSSIRELIRKKLFDFGDENGIGPSDVLVVYLAGHGVSRWDPSIEHWYFLPTGVKGEVPLSQTITVDDLKRYLAAVGRQAPSTLIFIDACRNFATSYPDADTKGFNPKVEAFQLSSEYKAAVFQGAGRNQFAYELPDTDLAKPDPKTCKVTDLKATSGGGAFTHALLKQLRIAEAQGARLGRFAEDLNNGLALICERQELQYSLPSSGFDRLFPPD
ncbi:caspase family protein [Bradyrhizobium sp. cf659]|uniref:caspase family protein n=1 Tax=Bradyrhizobium sp. cf659 TaxID=1761771 RepID=UPI0008EE1D57|nr:caspase family protein [Bradyrhizobium sp. cf659]SFJ98023.1 Caspase domain-containing protein [Bradyrhizobium sp. cf659]